MKKKRFILVLLFILTLCVSSCEKEEDDVNQPQESPEGEYIISDEKLINTTSVDDNYRVFYEIFTGSFSDSNGDGTGDLQGIINRLDYLNDGNPNSGKSLGIQGIWLTPIFASPSYHKYDVTDYYQIDSKFGTMNDLQELINECHKRDIKIILDLVINHTGNNNAWFANFVRAHENNDVESPYYDYYTYYKAEEERPIGTYKKIGTSTDLYECNFSTDMPELNFDNEEVRAKVLEIAKYYLDMGVDGFRFDAAKYIYYSDNEKSALFWKWYVEELKKIKSDIYIVGEVWSADAITDIYFEQGLSCFNFTVSGISGRIATAAKGGSVSAYTSYVENYLNKIKGLHDDSMLMQFITNHDMDRAAGFLSVSDGYMHMAANLYILSNGSPFIYYGEEIGMKGSRGTASTDANRRIAMLWGDEDKVISPVGTTYSSKYQINGTVKEHIINPNSLYNHYKKLIMLRNANPEIARGDYVSLNSDLVNVGGFTSTYNGSTVCVIHNSGLEEVTIDLTSMTSIQFTELRGYAGLNKATLNGNLLTIGGQTSVVLK